MVNRFDFTNVENESFNLKLSTLYILMITARVTFSHPIAVSPEDIDEMGHVNNVVYLRWVQEAATAHWMNNAPEELHSKYAWVVLRHEIDYVSAAVLNDK